MVPVDMREHHDIYVLRWIKAACAEGVCCVGVVDGGLSVGDVRLHCWLIRLDIPGDSQIEDDSCAVSTRGTFGGMSDQEREGWHCRPLVWIGISDEQLFRQCELAGVQGRYRYVGLILAGTWERERRGRHNRRVNENHCAERPDVAVCEPLVKIFPASVNPS